MQLVDFEIQHNTRIAANTYRILLSPGSSIPPPAPGQFVNIQLEGRYLRRPISVCDWDGQTLTLIYKAVGEGTKQLAGYAAGQRLNLLLWLGNGYDYSRQGTGDRRQDVGSGQGTGDRRQDVRDREGELRDGEQDSPLATSFLPPDSSNIPCSLSHPTSRIPCLLPPPSSLLIGGGVGVPPLYYLAKELLRAGRRPVAILGFNRADEVFYLREFAKLCETIVTTADGSLGQKGFVTHAMESVGNYDALYACGPEAMLKAIYDQAAPLPPGRAQFSFERRMGCGFGACMACSCRTLAGSKRICVDGPVLAREEIIWE
ncbi:MAG: dihydroorotate dehydrogenase electron transfer subunit [Oscillospiraceae bacterium]|jgi:dihydroorotate dehydrogenase electron transfer subunit|nr:dihydroorotate dehydrogenase electron transfer subunit [Oscillospiraceae bacterium]